MNKANVLLTGKQNTGRQSIINEMLDGKENYIVFTHDMQEYRETAELMKQSGYQLAEVDRTILDNIFYRLVNSISAAAACELFVRISIFDELPRLLVFCPTDQLCVDTFFQTLCSLYIFPKRFTEPLFEFREGVFLEMHLAAISKDAIGF